MKRPALQNKRVGVLRMAFRAGKVFGTFEKRAPERNSGPVDLFVWSALLKLLQQDNDNKTKSLNNISGSCGLLAVSWHEQITLDSVNTRDPAKTLNISLLYHWSVLPSPCCTIQIELVARE